MISMRFLLNSIRCGVICLLLGALSWGQVATSAPEVLKPVPASGATPEGTPIVQSQRGETSSVALDVPVITISGLCASPPTDNAAASNCRTVITRAGFEKVIAAIQPNMPARARREFAMRYAKALVMARKAEQMGLDKGANFEEEMEVARIQVLSQELNKAIQRESSQISDKDIIDYYHDNTSAFEQVEMDRIYVPKTQGQPALPDKTLSAVDAQKQSQRAEQFMKEVADNLHTRAIAGEDFNELQTDAYKIAGIKATAGPSMGKIRRISLPPSQVRVMDLKPGEISSVVEGPNGYFIYRVRSKETLSVDQAREEIKGILRSRRIEDETRAIEESRLPPSTKPISIPYTHHKE